MQCPSEEPVIPFVFTQQKLSVKPIKLSQKIDF